MVYSYQVIKFQTISFVQGVHWSQSVGDKGILYKSIGGAYCKPKELYTSPKGLHKAHLRISMQFLRGCARKTSGMLHRSKDIEGKVKEHLTTT